MRDGGASRRRYDPGFAALIALGSVGLFLAAAAYRGGQVEAPAAGVVAVGLPALAIGLVSAVVLARRGFVLRWRTLVSSIVVVILFVPVGRYALPGGAAFQLEPYRVLVAAVAVLWFACLLIQPQTRTHSSGFAGPLAAVAFAVLLSVCVNAGRVAELGVSTDIVKTLTFFASFIIVMLFVSSSLDTVEDIDAVVATLVVGGGVVAAFTIIESRTGFNAFNHLQRFVPVLQFDAAALPDQLEQRGASHRALASAQHPIALGAALTLLLPLGVYLARKRGGRIWWGLVGLTALGVLATAARTATVMLLVEVVVLLALQPRAMFRLWPWAIPFLLVVHIAVPGTLGGLKDSFLPRGGLVAEQQQGAGTYGSNRLADLGPGLEEIRRKPYIGQGFGTRITERSNPKHNAPILDNEWLGWTMQTGLAGFLALAWLFVRAVRRLSRAALRTRGEQSWLYAALAASIAAFAFGMLTYDALSFTQVTFLLFIQLGLAGASLRIGAPEMTKTRARGDAVSGAQAGAPRRSA